MKILAAIVHHWNPDGGGRHASLRPNPQPRTQALQEQLISLRRLANRQGAIDMGVMEVTDANQSIRHVFDIRIVTDGEHTVLGRLPVEIREMVNEEVRIPYSQAFGI